MRIIALPHHPTIATRKSYFTRLQTTRSTQGLGSRFKMVAVEGDEDDSAGNGQSSSHGGQGNGHGQNNGEAKRVRPRFQAMPSFAEEQQPMSPVPIDAEVARSPVTTTASSYLQTSVL